MQLADYIKLEQAKALYNNLKLILIGTLGVVAVTTWVFWGNVSTPALATWFLAACVIIILRWHTSRGFDPNNIDPERVQGWLNRHVFWGFVNGAHWGLIPLFFLTHEVTIYTLFVTSVYTGYVSSAMSTDTAYFKSFFSFALPSSLLFIGRALFEGGELYIALALLVGFFLIMLSYLSLNAQKFFMQARELNYRNMSLMNELRLQKETAEQATLAKDQFLAAASHDLRQPLNAVSLFINALGSMKIEAAGKQILEKIRQSMHSLNGMLHGLLDISRLDSSVVENHPVHMSLNDAVRQLVEEHAPKAFEKGITIRAELPDTMTVYVDTILFNRVLRNLIDNAVKYTSVGGVTLAATEHNQLIRLAISDTGIGIATDQQKNVFNEFYQLNNPERDRQKGLGLGLAIVQRLCILMDIRIQLTSNEGQGTSVVLDLPMGDQRQIPISDVGTRLQDLGHLTIAILDDEEDILDGMQRVLHAWGCNTVAASDYHDLATSLLNRSVRPDLLIADFRLRAGKTGINAIEDLREEFNTEIPAILVTGDTAPDRVKEASNADVEVLYKPIEADELKQTILRIMSKKSD